MPRARVVLFQERDGTVPLLDWLRDLEPKARTKCRIRLERLAELGHELRRPEADYVGDGLYELRARHRGVRGRLSGTHV